MALVKKSITVTAQFRALKHAIQEGLASGETDKTVKEIWTEAERRYRARQHG